MSELKIVLRTGMLPSANVVEAIEERDHKTHVAKCECGDEHWHANETNDQWEARCRELGADFGRMINHRAVTWWREGLIAALTGDQN